MPQLARKKIPSNNKNIYNNKKYTSHGLMYAFCWHFKPTSNSERSLKAAQALSLVTRRTVNAPPVKFADCQHKDIGR
jgi:hypothetical protein